MGTTMASMATSFTLVLIFFYTFLVIPFATANSKKIYFIHMNQHAKPNSFSTHHQWYHSLTSSPDSIIYTYSTIFHGFAAHLDHEGVESLRKLEHVLNVFEDKVYSIQTTYTPHFLGLNSNFKTLEGGELQEIERASEDVIIGVLDCGVWPESESFRDTGLPPIPKRWAGKCTSTKDFDHRLCNRKLIGARYFLDARKKSGEKDKLSPRDYNGHGTHTASTAAGSPVANASMFGYAKGTARGMAYRARVSCYKVCGDNGGCSGVDILKGMEQAMMDGVDIMSLSLSITPDFYYKDLIAVGAFYASQLGIIVSMAGGNSGPSKSSVANLAPWILTVAAGSVDRDFPAYAILGNRHRFSGVTLYKGPTLGPKPLPLVYNKGDGNSSSNFCLDGTLEPEKVRGKVVVCNMGDPGQAKTGVVVQKAGGAAMILVANGVAGRVLDSDLDIAPGMVVENKEGDLIKKYVKSVANPTVKIGFGGTVFGVKPAPVASSFSSRGPSFLSPEILKPGIMAPGVNILAAYSEATSPTNMKEDARRTKYVIISGTSMACPHVSGIAALLKAAHPRWSPSALKSAMMTTAFTIDNANSPIIDEATDLPSNPWAYGSGHIDPKKALSRGLVYNNSLEDYITFMCSLGYPLPYVQGFVNDPNITCSKKFGSVGEMNYPSFSVVFADKTVVKYSRELTNVGAARSTYNVTVDEPPTVSVTVQPSVLVFKNLGDKQIYSITFTAKKNKKPTSEAEFGSIVWSNKQYQVRSPIAIAWS